MESFGSVQELLAWLLNAGGVILLASWVLDKIPQFAPLPPELKKLINKLVVVILALGVYALQTYVPVEVWEVINPWLSVASGVLVVYSAQQAYHQQVK